MKSSTLVAALLPWLASCAQPPRPGDALEQALARGEFPRTTSVLLERGGSIVAERYWAGSDATALHDTRSVGKSVNSLAVGIAHGADSSSTACPSCRAPQPASGLSRPGER
jgi:hypothetical protein